MSHVFARFLSIGERKNNPEAPPHVTKCICTRRELPTQEFHPVQEKTRLITPSYCMKKYRALLYHTIIMGGIKNKGVNQKAVTAQAKKMRQQLNTRHEECRKSNNWRPKSGNRESMGANPRNRASKDELTRRSSGS